MKQQEKQGRHTFKFSIYLVIRSKNEERRTCAAPFQLQGTKIEGLTGKGHLPSIIMLAYAAQTSTQL